MMPAFTFWDFVGHFDLLSALITFRFSRRRRRSA